MLPGLFFYGLASCDQYCVLAGIPFHDNVRTKQTLSLSLFLSLSRNWYPDAFSSLLFLQLWSCGLLQYIELQSHEAENSIKLWFKYENFWLFQNNSLEGKTHTFHGFALIKHNSSNGFLIEHFSQCWIHSLVAFIEHTVLEIVVLAWLINHFSSFSEILSPTLLNYTPVRFP